MEKLTVEFTMDQIQKAVEKHVMDVASSSYSNPIRKAVEDAINEKNGPIKELVNEIISASLLDPKFKEQLGSVVMAKMFESAFKK